MNAPVVTVVCLCYNQGRFVRESVESVLHQSYRNVELIIVDDASDDNSADIIREIKTTQPQVEILLLEKNAGSCSSFNLALAMATGEYVIDLAADDILLPNRIERGLQAFTHAGNEFGVHFSDAEYIDEAGNGLGVHSSLFPHSVIPQGDIYVELIHRYFICPSSLMMRTDMMKKLGGYDESLDYEDFDFLVRAARSFKFVYSPEVLVKKRRVKDSLSSRQNRLFSRHSRTTYRVCKKILGLNRSKEERYALAKRIRYEIFFNLRLLNFDLVFLYLFLLYRNAATAYQQ